MVGAATEVMNRLVTYLLNPLILVIFAAGFFLFVWGLVQFLWSLNQGGKDTDGKQHMLWGIVGMFIMVSVYGILSLVTNTFGIDIRNPPDVSSIRGINNVGGFR